MSIRTKVFGMLFILLLGTAAVNFIVQRFVIYPSFLELEYQEIGENLKRILHAIDREISHLEKMSGDWAVWDNAHSFMTEQTEEFINSNLNQETLEADHFNLIVFCRPDGTIVWHHGMDFSTEKSLNFDFLAGGKIADQHPLLAVRNLDSNGKGTSGIFPSQFGLMLFATREILHSDGSGPGNGYLILGRQLDAAIVKALREQTRIAFSIAYPLPDGQNLSQCGLGQNAAVRQSGALSYATIPEGEHIIKACTTYRSPAGVPLFGVQYLFPRETTRKGIDSIRYATILVMCFGGLIVLILGMLLQSVILQPVQRLTEHASNLERERDFSARLNLQRQDEIGRLGHSFDALVQTIDEQTRELKAANEQLIMMSMLDGLTGIANRRLFDANISKEWRRAMREQTPLSLVLLDVDYFKNYNDTYGHQRGDQCLITVAQALQQQVHRPADLVARYGGEEFVMVLPNTPVDGAMLLAERAREAVLDLKIEHGDSKVGPFVTVSLGVVTMVPIMDRKDEGLQVLLHKADLALYQAKNQGRNQVVCAA